MRELTLVLPGILWPADTAAEIVRGLDLTALERLLHDGTASVCLPMTAEQAVCAEWDLDPASTPYAALRRLGEGATADEHVWMCADPVHMRIMRDMLVLDVPESHGIEPGECAAMLESLNATFSDIGRFECCLPHHWYVQMTTQPAATMHSVSHVLGRNLESFMPAGADGAAWRRTINEIQMLLHGHSVNALRETAGKAPINSLWFWGAGRLPQSLPHVFDAVHADRGLARGLAQLSETNAMPVPTGFAELAATASGERVLVLVDALERPALQRDVDTWRDAMDGLEANWFAPLYEAASRVRIRLVMLGDTARIDLACRARRWWSPRRSRGLADFIRTHQPT